MEELLHLAHGVARAVDGVTLNLVRRVDLVVVLALCVALGVHKHTENRVRNPATYGVRLVAKEVDLSKACLLDVLQAVGLIPADWQSVSLWIWKKRARTREDVEGDLAADRVLETERRELGLERLHEPLADAVLLHRA